jgi:hypothetical protein
MKIINVNDLAIVFDNGNIITYNHTADCCENNYADFEQIEDFAYETEFEEELIFEGVPESGFRFGNKGKMFFIPCYSEQNGFYSSDVDIYYNDELVLNVACEEKFY